MSLHRNAYSPKQNLRIYTTTTMTEVVVAGSNSRAVAAASANDIDAIKIAQSIPKGASRIHTPPVHETLQGRTV